MVKDEEDEQPEAVVEVAAAAFETVVGVEDDARSPEAGHLLEPVSNIDEVKSEDDQALTDHTDESQSLESSKNSSGQVQVRRKARSSGLGAMRFLFFMLLAGSLTSLYNYKMESAPIGFCDTGKTTNAILESIVARRAAIEECNRLNRTTLYSLPHADSTQSVIPPTPAPAAAGSDDSQLVLSETCPPPPLLPIPQPESCAPCPEHASCTPSTVTCENGYLLQPHPLLAFLSLPVSRLQPNVPTYNAPSLAVGPTHGNLTAQQLAYTALSLLLDGLPGLGPVALPPQCVEDPRRKRHINALGRRLDALLMQERGNRHCDGARPEDDKLLSESQRAKKWGMEVDALKEILRKKSAVSFFL